MSFDYERFVAKCKAGLDAMKPEEVLALVEKYSDSESDLDAAWAWFRGSGYSLKENETGTGRNFWMCYNRLTALSSETADSAVLAAWRAANNNEKGEK